MKGRLYHYAVIALAGLWLAAMAADTPPAPVPLTENQRLRWENALLKQQLAQAQVEQAQRQAQISSVEGGAVYTAICQEHGITAKDIQALSDVCAIDGKTVTRKAPATPAAPAPAKK